MIFQHVVEMPRLYSGTDRQGRPWTVLLFPKAFGEALAEMTSHQRVATLRGLVKDFRRNT